MSNRIPNWIKVLMLKGEKGDAPHMSEVAIDNGFRVTIENPDGTTSSFDLMNATSGDYEQLSNKPFRIVTGEIEDVSANSTASVQLTASALRSAGIEDASKYAIISVGECLTPTNNVYRNAYFDGSSAVDTTYATHYTSPRAYLHWNVEDITQDTMTVYVHNLLSSPQSIPFIVVLMKVVEWV